MKDALLTILRDRKTSLTKFRSASDKLASILAAEVAQETISSPSFSIETPLAKTQGYQIKHQVMLIPILRSGISLLHPFLLIFEDAKIAFLGIKRDEKTALPALYYENIPNFSSEDLLIILDPMIATGGSAILAIQQLLENGASLNQIYLVGVIGSTEGIQRIQKEFPSLKMKIVAEDPELNVQKFIVPGLGDFGDRYFGSAHE